MSNVTPLREGVPELSERKQQFLDNVSLRFDEYVAECGYEPDALVYVLAGLTQTAQSGWMVSGASQGGGRSILSLAAVVLLREAQE